MQDAASEARPQAGGEHLVGRAVACADGGIVGRIRSLRVSDDGTVTYAVISLGSFPRMGDDLRAVPLDLLREVEERVGLSCPADLLRSAPILASASRCADAQFCLRVAAHFESLG
jgi:hypothetical protein